MSRHRFLTLAFSILTAAFLFAGLDFSAAQTPGPATTATADFDRKKELDAIFSELASAPSQPIAQAVADRMWQTFLTTPDAETTEDMNQALRQASSYNFAAALDIFDVVIARHPDYAEPWNQRAYVHFQNGDYEKSLADCEKTLELEPRHIGCMTGMARILIRKQQRFAAGRGLLEQALKLHPFVYEKVLLDEIPEEYR